MRKAVVIGKKVWFFLARNKKEERGIADTILFWEPFCASGIMSFRFNGTRRLAKALRLTKEQRRRLENELIPVVEVRKTPSLKVLFPTGKQKKKGLPED